MNVHGPTPRAVLVGPLRIFLAALLVGCVPGAASAGWSRLSTKQVVFVGDAPDAIIRRVAQKLDQFREVLTRALPGADTKSPVPTVVVVFRNDRSLTPYKPLFQGRPVKVAGFFQAAEDVNYIAVNGEADEEALHTIYHEYTHFLVGNTAGSIPAWMNEGLAELYATFEERSGGASALLGAPDLNHVALLRESATLVPLGELMAVDHSSPVYNEGNRRSLFYAESWALMHYLLLGDRERARQLGPYLEKLRSGAAPEQAFRDAFGDVAALEKELYAYVRRYQFLAARFNFPDKVKGAKSDSSQRIDDAEANAYLADLLARSGRIEEARANFQQLIEADPRSARALYGLGRLELDAGHPGEALPLVERAVALDGNEGAYQTTLGRALLAKWDADKNGPDGAEALQRARTVLARSAELDPNAVTTLAALGRAELAAGSDLPRARSLLEQAVRMAPSREYYRLLLAACLAAQNDFELARAHLGPLIARGTSAQIRDAARDLMGRISAVSAGMPAHDAPGAPRVAVPGDRPAPSRREPAAASTFTPILRKLRPGEIRVQGMFTAVECRRDGIVFSLTLDDRVRRFAAAKFDQVEFITYHAQIPGGVRCGAVQPPSRVLATYRAAGTPEGIDGQLVAIEVLPDGYTPK